MRNISLEPRKPKTLDLFCGIGGLTIGLERAGFESLGGVDIWKDAGETFVFNIPSVPFLEADLTAITPQELLNRLGIKKADLDLIAGGPPCQGFSTVGKRDVDDPRNRLWTHYLKIVDYIRPSYVLIENVEGLNVMKGGQVRDSLIAAFHDIGYRMKSRVLISAQYGVPQLRKRIVFLGWLPGLQEPIFPVPTHSEDSYVTVDDAISDLPALRSGESRTTYTTSAQSEFQKNIRSMATHLENHHAANHPPHLVELLSHIPDGGNRKSIPDHLQPKSGFHNSYARLASFKPAVAVTSNMRKPSSARATHPRQNRGLTVREGLRLQTFPDTFVVQGSRSSQYLQVGNAVPPILAERIGHEILVAYRANAVDEVIQERANKAKLERPVSTLHVQPDLLADSS